MARPTDRDSFKEYCLRKLGEPVLKVNVALEQLDDRVDEALFKFYERHYEGVEEHYIVSSITDEDVLRGHLVLPSDVLGVSEIFRPITSGTNSVEYQYYITDIFNTSNLFSSIGDMSYYVMASANLSLLKRYFSADRQFDYNQLTNKLIVAGGLANAQSMDGAIVIRCWRKLLGDAEDIDDPSHVQVHNIWRNKWLQDYATALIKKQWAQNMFKFTGVQMIGGISLNAEGLMTQADQEIEKLELQLQDEYSEPPMFIWA